MTLIIRFVDYVQAHAVAELIEPGHIRIVAGAHGVEIVCFYHAQVLQCLVHTADRARDRVRFVAVDAPEGNGRTVQGQDTVFDFDFAETHLFGDDFAAGIHDQGVENRFFCVPEKGLLDRDGD